ncbi:cytochrome P450 [Kibdelosporangium philippinense]|uniref:Cytochrome P450 n=1 Tax=Kibdelosporangium philippinense TaxID=211113 RepID=A0ABS8ZKH5_9PSEU|nr:cytochrome P450 [Kibdelosporangium philippinense]MCE7007136.1 cytochrome P450 [Kibdelosporangium philippinense]
MNTVYRLPALGEALPLTYARFRAAGPVIPVELPGGVQVWAVTTYAAVREVLEGDDIRFGKHYSHWAALRDGQVPGGWPFLPLVYGEHMLMRDGSAHGRLRNLLMREFTAERIEALKESVAKIVDSLIAAVVAEGKVADLVPSFAEQVPMAVICELFGIPAGDRARLRSWTRTLFSHEATAEETHLAGQRLIAFMTALADWKRQEPGDDLTSALVRDQNDDQLSLQELVDCLYLILIAGHETTLHMIGHAIVGLLANPSQLTLAMGENRWADVVEEALRRTPPVYGSLFRYALADTEVAGKQVFEGDALLLCIGGSGTDPAQHGPLADQFDITRDQKGHLAFGHGPHQCIGAPLARIEGEMALSALFNRLPDMKPAIPVDEIPYSPSFLTYGPLSIPVVLNNSS